MSPNQKVALKAAILLLGIFNEVDLLEEGLPRLSQVSIEENDRVIYAPMEAAISLCAETTTVEMKEIGLGLVKQMLKWEEELQFKEAFYIYNGDEVMQRIRDMNNSNLSIIAE
jgi:hypothetical protein